MTTEEMCERLQQTLKPGRYRHTLRVADTAVSLAENYGYPADRAFLAGLLHDCGKSDGDALTHAGIGARLARDVYGVDDPEILSAIACHTTGRPEMTLLEKIIFTADYIEPGRDKAPRLDFLRMRAYEDLDDTILCILEDTLSYLKEKGTEIDERSLQTYTYYYKRKYQREQSE